MILRKKIAGFLLVFLLVVPVIIFLFFFGHQKFVRWQMEEKLEHGQLTTITLNVSDFKWYEEGKEIVVYGHLFDVKTIKKLNDQQLVITGLYDYQEQQLHKDLDNWVNNKNNSSNERKQLFKWLSDLYDDKIYDQYLNHSSVSDKSEYSFHNLFAFSIASGVLTPPPRQLFL